MSAKRPRPWHNPTPLPDFVPVWAGQFDTFNDWVSHASRALTGETGSMGEKLTPFCVDAKGRRCNIGKDFMRARDEETFPVRYFFEGTVSSQATEPQDGALCRERYQACGPQGECLACDADNGEACRR